MWSYHFDQHQHGNEHHNDPEELNDLWRKIDADCSQYPNNQIDNYCEYAETDKKRDN